jgi:hypothetical protein
MSQIAPPVRLTQTTMRLNADDLEDMRQHSETTSIPQADLIRVCWGLFKYVRDLPAGQRLAVVDDDGKVVSFVVTEK